ncbi:MAG: ribokinase [Propioniciclava sp.]|uniref:ribokinase n=1 Tax=Propioniciclava sp. TaxID=2038686 RepID=UPI0039E41302
MIVAGRVLVVGSLNADLVVRTARIPKPGETVTGSDLFIVPGGKSANQAAAIGKLGGDVAILGCVGDDGNGAMLRASLEASGVDIGHLRVLSGVATGSAMIAVDSAGENCIIVSPGANGRLTTDDVTQADAFFDSAGPSSVLTLCLEVSVGVVKVAARRARERGATVVLNISPYMKVDADLLALVDILLVNAHELADLTGQAEFDPLGDWSAVVAATAAALGEDGPRTVVVTLGGLGARVIDLDAGTASDQIPSPKVTPVDTTGCGDAFLAALAFRLAAGDALTDACAFAVRVGAYAATGEGAQASYPTAEQLANWTP